MRPGALIPARLGDGGKHGMVDDERELFGILPGFEISGRILYGFGDGCVERII
jgi:hypothetical protein